MPTTDLDLAAIRARCEAVHPLWPDTTEVAEARETLALLAALERSEAASQWQPIETAPKEGEVLLRIVRAGMVGSLVCHWQPGGHCIDDHPPIDKGWYFWNGHMLYPVDSKPTHWAPIPNLPAGSR